MSVRVEWDDRELAEALKRVRDFAGRKVREGALLKAAEPVVRDARAKAPVRFGGIRRNLRAEVHQERGFVEGKSEVAVGVDERAFYALFAELGTVTQDATPFLRPAFDANRASVVRLARKELRAALLEAAE